MSRDDEEPTGDAGQEPERPAIPATPLAAYRAAAASLRETHPECHLPWELLAAIGMVESGHAWGGAVDPDGTMLEPIDGERRGAETVGPMQLSTAVWALWAAGGTPEAEPDPQNIHDAALTAGRFLCAPGRDLTRDADLHQAIRSFHNAPMYVRAVLSWMADYREGVREIPDRTEVGWSGIAADMVNHAWADVEELTGERAAGEEREAETAAAPEEAAAAASGSAETSADAPTDANTDATAEGTSDGTAGLPTT
ncbi:lytic transglycosylase domain-containing protein, partial [Streptomyces sp. A7024]|nr:lytic transglycosylase domain-containing protein [Streptomyces coryli]